ncbi:MULTISPECIES: hypothetical protein [Actinomadura]|uniref:Trp operon leader peptide n=1 Tax=Actinomadura yumaensis TaxID=111807 RepID=A0ABW2CVH6_9ACTN|nr:hypothetical protein [Actinomadura sp. J1-007]
MKPLRSARRRGQDWWWTLLARWFHLRDGRYHQHLRPHHRAGRQLGRHRGPP